MGKKLTLILFALGFACSGAQAVQKPNIIVVVVDDLGWGDIGYNNPGHVYTPNLDRLASQGITLEQHYSMPQCTPTRIALFTGKYPGRFGNEGLMATNKKVFQAGTPTLASMLKAEGYRTYLCGKWHMGCDTVDGPNNHGFDESYGSMGGAVGMYDHRYRTGPYEQSWHRNHKPIAGNEDGTHATDLVTRDAQRVIQTESEQPFFMYLAYHAPHTPLDERGDFTEQPTRLDTAANRWVNEDKIRWFNDPKGIIQSEPDPEKRLFLAAVHHLDFAIGAVFKTLEKTGKATNTLVYFTSDNGPQVNWPGNAYPNDLHLTDFNQPIPMRGSKTDVWEGGIHVPGFVLWPGKIEPGKVPDAVHVVDCFPTIAKIVGAKTDAKLNLDGHDLTGLLLAHKPIPERDLYWIWNSKTNKWALRNGDWKIVKYGEGEPKQASEWQLFNLKTDPRETTNLAQQNPGMVNNLHTLFLKQRAKDKKTN